MRILVTGASGFVGRALVPRLVAQEHVVVGVSRNPSKTAETLDLALTVDWAALDEAFATGIDAVIHLAGETVQGRWNAEKAERVRASRIEGTQTLLDAMGRAEQPPAVMLSASGIGFYGEGGEAELNEQAGPGDDYFASLCVDWEGLAASAQAIGCRVCMLRFGIIMGPGGGALSAMLLPTLMGVGGRLGSGKQWWSWVALQDAVSAIIHLLESDDTQGPVNIVAPEPVRQIDFQRSLSRALKRPSFMPAPGFAIRLLLGTFAEEILSSKRVLPSALTASGFEWSSPGLDETLRASVS